MSERVGPLVDRANSPGAVGWASDGASILVKQRAADAAGEKVAPAIRQFVTEDLGAAGTPADVSAEQAAQQIPSTRMYHGTSSEFASVDPSQIAGENNLPGAWLLPDERPAGGRWRGGARRRTGRPVVAQEWRHAC